MDLLERLEDTRAGWNVLAHPFYTRWEKGDLTSEELAFYAAEYRHAVVALARVAAQAAAEEPELLEHSQEEAAHIALWDAFAWAAGADAGRPARRETAECVRSWANAADSLEALAILYAIEAGQPAIAATKLEGLVDHYGFAPEGPATAYFHIHRELDRDHADQARRLIEERALPEDANRLVAAATGALEGSWTLLDGVDAAPA